MIPIKSSTNTIGLFYYNGLLNENEINEITTDLKTVDIEFLLFDKSGRVYNSLEDFSNIVFVVIQSPFIFGVLSGVIGNATWDLVKLVIFKLWKKMKGQTYNRITPSKIEEKEITFGVNVALDKNTQFNFNLNGKMSDEVILSSIDKILDFINQQTANKNYEHPYYVVFDPENKQWEKINVWEQIKMQHQKKTNEI